MIEISKNNDIPIGLFIEVGNIVTFLKQKIFELISGLFFIIPQIFTFFPNKKFKTSWIFLSFTILSSSLSSFTHESQRFSRSNSQSLFQKCSHFFACAPAPRAPFDFGGNALEFDEVVGRAREEDTEEDVSDGDVGASDDDVPAGGGFARGAAGFLKEQEEVVALGVEGAELGGARITRRLTISEEESVKQRLIGRPFLQK